MRFAEPADVNVLRSGTAGLLLGISVPPSPLGPVAWIALVPLLIGWHTARFPRTLLVEAFLAFAVAGSIAFGWIMWHPSVSVVLASIGALLTWALMMALPWTVGVWFYRRNQSTPSSDISRPRSDLSFLLLAAGILIVEGIFTHAPWPMPWGLLAHTQADVPWIRQMAALGGAPLLSAWVLGTNAAVVLLLRKRFRRAFALGFILVLVVGVSVWRAETVPPPKRTVSVLLVQPNTMATSWANIQTTTRVQHLRSLTNTALDSSSNQPALAVWPETALPPNRPAVRDSLQQWVNQTGVPLLTGAVASIDASGGTYRHTNRAVLFTPNSPTQHYDKVHPVPFVEHVPLAEFWPFLRRIRVDGGGVQGYRPGPSAVPLETPSLTLGPLICFESTVSPLALEYATGENEADALVTLAQTGWWDSSWPARQHLAISRLRAIETGRALTLVTVRGPSTVVHPDGSTGSTQSWNTEGTMIAELPIVEHETPYAQTGDLILPGALLLVLAGIAYFFLQ